MLSRLNFYVNSLTPHASKNKRHKPYFLPHVVTGALSSSKILTVGKLHWPTGWQQKHLWSKHPLQSNLQSISKTHIFFAWHICNRHRRNVPSPKRLVAETAAPNCPRPNFARTFLYTGRFLLTWPVTLRYQSLCSLVPVYLQGMSSHHFLFNFLGFL